MVWEKRAAEGVMKNSVSAADYLDWSRIAQSFTAMAAHTEVTADLTGEGDPEKLPLAAVSSPFFEVFGLRPLLGRTFETGEDLFGRHRVRDPRTRRSGSSASAATPRWSAARSCSTALRIK